MCVAPGVERQNVDVQALEVAFEVRIERRPGFGRVDTRCERWQLASFFIWRWFGTADTEAKLLNARQAMNVNYAVDKLYEHRAREGEPLLRTAAKDLVQELRVLGLEFPQLDAEMR